MIVDGLNCIFPELATDGLSCLLMKVHVSTTSMSVGTLLVTSKTLRAMLQNSDNVNISYSAMTYTSPFTQVCF